MKKYTTILFIPVLLCVLLASIPDGAAQYYPLPKGEPHTWNIPGREQRLYTDDDWGGDLPLSAGGPERYWENPMVWDKYDEDSGERNREAEMRQPDEAAGISSGTGVSGR